MELQEFYQGLLEGQREGTLYVSGELCGGALFGFLFVTEVERIEECFITMQMQQVVIDGKSSLYVWNKGEYFRTRLVCTEQKGEIRYQASFWSDYEGTLGEFFGQIAPAMIAEENGAQSFVSIVSDFPVSKPELSFDSGDTQEAFPLHFFAKTRQPKERIWDRYDFLSLQTLKTISGAVNKNNVFELEAPIENAVTGIFPCTRAALLLHNGAENVGNLSYPVVSQAGLKLCLQLSGWKEIDFTLPLFAQKGHWNLHTFIPGGLGIADIVNLLSDLFGVGGSASALHLPEDTALNKFKLYQIDLLTRQQELQLSMEYLMIQFALSAPWKLPVPYVTLERLSVGFEVSFGSGAASKNLLTAQAAGMLSVTLGSYKLTMALQMELPELSFVARTTLRRESGSPGLTDLAKSFDVALPGQWQQESHLLGEITVYGSGSGRSFAIEAGVYDILSFSVGNLKFALKEVQAGAEIATSHFRFFIQGLMEFDEGADAFSIYLKAVYNDKNWSFAGGLYQGEINIGKLLTKMFQMGDPAEDIFSLAITELDISYTQEDKKLLLTAAFEAGWNITLLGETFTLGGRIQLKKTGEEKPDLSALAYLTFAKFMVLVQIDHMQQKADRTFLFRMEYDGLYLQAAYFQREEDEILSVSLGGVTVGSLVESLVNKINPNKRFTLSAPWNLLNKIELSRFLFELNVTKKQAGFLYRADLNIAGLLYIENIGVVYDFGRQGGKLSFVLTGKFPGDTGKENKRYTWDAIDGQPPAGKADNEKKFELSYLGLGQHLKNDGAAKADSIAEAVKALKEQLNPESIEKGPAYDAGTNWLFGADFTVNGMLNVKIVLNDPHLYGILVTVAAKEQSALEFLDGFGLELLCRRVSSDVYMFRGELLMPKRFRTFQLGVVTLTLGTIRVDVYTNGGFCVDLGFPYEMDFSRSFVLEWGIFTGRGGIYFGVMKNVSVPNLPVAQNGCFSPIVTLGIGLSIGLGRSFDLGIVKGGVSLEAFGIFEGVLAVFHEEETQKESVYYYVKAAAGIVGRLYLSVDFKIITIQASAEIKASAMLTMQAYKASVVELELELDLKASIKILFIKISFSFHFQQKVSFTIGKDETAPWVEKQDTVVQGLRSASQLRGFHVNVSQKEQIHLSLLPLFYLEHPSLGTEAKKEYGAAFLMMMDEGALKQWTGLLVQWMLSCFPQDTVTIQQVNGLSPKLADTVTYAMLEEFLEENVMVSYEIHWVSKEEQLRAQKEEEAQRFVFPILPSFCLSFGEEDRQQTVNYWEEQPVGEDYFDRLTEYFRELNPNDSGKDRQEKLQETDGQTEAIPIAKVFFQDYFRMFLREVIGRMQGMFRQIVTDDGVCTAALKYGLPKADILRQNTELIFSPGMELVFPKLNYTTKESDTVGRIAERFSCDRLKLWESIRYDTFLLQTGSVIAYGEGEFHNEKSGFTLKQAAVFLFVRFYEERVPSDLFYAGDIVRLNDGISMDWKENLPGAHTLELPDYDGLYHTMRGDTPERIGKCLNLWNTGMEGMEGWQEFYEDICKRNESVENGIPSVIRFFVPGFVVGNDTDLADLADRIYPDYEEELPNGLLCSAPILKINTLIVVPQALFEIPKAPPLTVGGLLASAVCTVEELGEAVLQDSFFLEKQQICINGAQTAKKEDLLDWTKQDAVSIGAMLSRFLLQGLSVPAPEAKEEEVSPLFDVLRQMFPLGDGQSDRVIRVSSAQSGCTWVEADEKQQVMSWEQIEKRLPDGDFSVLPSAFVQLDDFVMSAQYLTLSDGASYYRGSSGFALYSFSKAVQEVLHGGQEEPLFVDQDGKEQAHIWGCLVLLSIRKCEEEGIFELYGADAQERLVLHYLLSLADPSVHMLYQASGISKGGQNFLECDWQQECYIVKTNLSKETHMGRAGLRSVQNSDEAMHNIVSFAQKKELLRMIWECSTVGGGGYYIRLMTADGQTLPDDIFDEQRMGELWLLLTEENFAQLSGYANCCIFENTMLLQNTVTLVTRDILQEKPQPVFPAGCVGLHSEMCPPDGGIGISENEEYMRSLFQITGYQIVDNEYYRKSHMSAPLLPEKHEDVWHYNTVVPMYRYLSGQCGEAYENPYLCVGKQGKAVLMLKDILGNAVQAGETGITPYYNDVLIGIGQYPGAKVSYALLEEDGVLLLKLVFHSAFAGQPGGEAVEYQRRASMQLDCPDIQVTLDSPVSAEKFSFAQLERDGRSYLELLREYVKALAEAMEQGQTESVPDTWVLDFPLHMEQYPLPAEIFELKTLLTVSRSGELVTNEAAQHTVTVVTPSAFFRTTENGEEEKNLLAFCKDAQKAIKNLHLAQKAEGNGVLYGISFGEQGFIKKLDVSFGTYDAETLTGEKQTVRAPEFYAFAPLYHGFLSRGANVRTLDQEFAFLDEFSVMEFSDVDMELWAKQLLEDIEGLLLSGPVKKAAAACRHELDALVTAKGQIAHAVAQQLLLLRTGGGLPDGELKEAATDRLGRSLKDGYGMDITAVCQLSFLTKGGEKCRLAAVAQNDMEGTQTAAAKAESGKDTMALYFTNSFTGKSIPLQMELVFTELEYNIKADLDGYESSEWLRFVEPVGAWQAKAGQGYGLESQIALPNPLKACPQSPVLTGHTCSIEELVDDTSLLSEEKMKRIGWDYALTMRYCYREQDTFFIRIEFESMIQLLNYSMQRDLFDVLAEYSLVRDSLWKAISEEDAGSSKYQNAYSSFVDIMQEASQVWEEWVLKNRQEVGTEPAFLEDGLEEPLVYSCMAWGVRSDGGIRFQLNSTKEGEEFLKLFGMEGTPPYIEVADAGSDTKEAELKFVMKHLPLFACAQAVPKIKIIRNQNLLSGDGFALAVREDFIYRTQEVSLPVLPVTGEYTEEYLVASITDGPVTQEVMEKAVSEIYQFLQLDNQNLMAEIAVSYYYGLNQGESVPRVQLPVTLLPCMDTVTAKGDRAFFTENLGKNIYQWYQENTPDTNHCGLLFDVRIYQKNTGKRLLGFSGLNVAFSGPCRW